MIFLTASPTLPPKPLIFGRDSELQEVIDSINNQEKSITLIIGEPGIGESQFLDAAYYELNKTQQNENSFFIGYYDKGVAVNSEHPSLIYPFLVVLSSDKMY